jgi:hypothetical protein
MHPLARKITPLNLMVFHLWAHRTNEKRRNRGDAIHVEKDALAILAYETDQTLADGERVETLKQGLENPESEAAQRERKWLVKTLLAYKTCLEGLTRRQDTLRLEGKHKKADAINSIRQDQEQTLMRRATELNKLEQQKRKRGNPRHKYAARYFGLAMAPIVQAIIGHNTKLVFRTSSTGAKIPKGAKSKRRIAQSNFTEPAGDLLKILRPQTPRYAGDLVFTRRDLDWMAGRYRQQRKTI